MLYLSKLIKKKNKKKKNSFSSVGNTSSDIRSFSNFLRHNSKLLEIYFQNFIVRGALQKSQPKLQLPLTTPRPVSHPKEFREPSLHAAAR